MQAVVFPPLIVRTPTVHRDTLIANNQLNSETLRVLYKDVKQRTSNNFTYSMGSHVMQYGNLKISGETLDGWLEESLSRAQCNTYDTPAH